MTDHPTDANPTAPAADPASRAPAPAHAPERSRGGGRTGWTVGAVVAVLVGVGVAVWEGGLKHEVIPKNFGVVEEGAVYRAGKLTPHTLGVLVRDRGIRTVVDFGAYRPDSDEWTEMQAAAAEFGVDWNRLNMRGDGTGDPNHFAQALRILSDEANHPALVMCAAGAQRTGACVVMYRVIVQGEDPELAYERAWRHDHDPKDNPRLPLIIGTWLDEVAHSYRTGEPIAYDPTHWRGVPGGAEHTADDDAPGHARTPGDDQTGENDAGPDAQPADDDPNQ